MTNRDRGRRETGLSEALNRAIGIAGGQTQLARLLGVKQAHVWHWLNRAERIPAEYVLAIEEATGGAVSRHDLRPDLYPRAPAAEAGPVAEEDLWRGRIYALLGRCIARVPDTALLTALAQLDGDDTPFGNALDELATLARRSTAASAKDDYDALFVGITRGELVPYASFYRTGFLYERPLAELRQDMKTLGLAAAKNVPEPEDHIGALCEMMALLIEGGGGPAAPLAKQQTFFQQHLAPWAERFFADLERAEAARLYRPVGTIGRLFMSIETQAFALAA
jgi:TorA maturation chaperone TorD/DNA-binding transcriptional regulator YdaS (Cro superfamily)